MGFPSFDTVMFSRSLLLLGIVCSAVLVFAAKTAMARPSGPITLDGSADFDLARSPSARSHDQRFRLGSTEGARRFREEKIKPQVTYSPIDGGPTVELGALGGGRKGTPKLAHVGVDWSF